MISSFNRGKIRGTVVLMSKNVLDRNASGGVGSEADGATAIPTVALQLIEMGNGKVGKQTFVRERIPQSPTSGARQDAFKIYFDWNENLGMPGAFYIKNYMQAEFFLVSVTLEDIPNHDSITFVCNSWVYNERQYGRDRIFFANQPYLPSETPDPLSKYRKEELENLRGDGQGERKEWDRIYDYDVYNDLGNPDRNTDLSRSILGGSTKFPYPRRGRTGRQPTEHDGNSERPGEVYVPRDERFGLLKLSDFAGYAMKASKLKRIPDFYNVFGDNEFHSFEEVHCLYEGGVKLPTHGEEFLKYPTPQVIQVSKSAWMTDEEFAREMLAGINPCMIRRLQESEFPPKSKLDPTVYGNQTSTITKQHLEKNLDGLTVEKAIKDERLFILDHHDTFMPYLNKINEPIPKAYATRTILLLKGDGTLKPLAIELSLPHPNGYCSGAKSKVILPSSEQDHQVKGTIWLLAKAYVIVNDSCYHQLMSHWLKTHCSIEPFIIATNRCLSVLHPIHKLLYPHYRDTMHINALARASLINAGGIIEKAFLPGKFAMEMSSAVYKDWVFPEQALPIDLIKRGMAVKDTSKPHGLRLVIEDYPYALDGLEIWQAINTWVHGYVILYYKSNTAVKKDTELQEWWKEVVEKGHGDMKDKPWWPKLHTVEELIESLTIIIWLASAFHAAVNFGQYPYGGLILNRPTLTRRLIPESGTPEYVEMEKDHQKAFLRTITPKAEALVDLTVLEILSMHASDEIYLGEREHSDWTSDSKAIQAFKKFGNQLEEIQRKIEDRNKDPNLINRLGPVQIPYTLLLPTSKEGLTCRGIPNSVSI